jgi:hypothetical protein
MRKSGERRGHALCVAAGAAFLLGLSGCAGADPLIDRSGGNTGGAVPTSGAGLPGTAGIPGVAGISGPAGAPAAGHGIAGTPVIAGAQAVAGTSGATSTAGAGAIGGPLPAFDAGNASLNMVQAGAVCSRLATLDCAGEAHCCNSPGRTVATCQSDIMTACTQTLYLDTLSQNPITGFDKSAAASAFTVLEQKASQCDISVASWGASVDGLRSIFKGTIAPGKSCKPTQNLMDKATAGAALASCTGIAATACLPKSVLGDWTCSPKNAAGGSCLTDNNCNDGLYCNLPSTSALGKCAATLPVGSSCTAPSQCTSLFCKNSVCVAADQQAAYCLKM